MSSMKHMHRAFEDLKEEIDSKIMSKEYENAFQYIYPYKDHAGKTHSMYRLIRKVIKKERCRLISVSRIDSMALEENQMPAMLRYSNDEKSKSFLYVRSGDYELPLFNMNEKGTATIHVAFGTIKIVLQDKLTRKESTVRTFRSIVINEERRKNAAVMLYVAGPHACLLIERDKNTKCKLNYCLGKLKNLKISLKSGDKKRSIKIPIIRQQNDEVAFIKQIDLLVEDPDEYDMNNPLTKIPISYIRKRLTIDELRQRILFLDCEFVGGYKELNKQGKWKGTSLLASISIIRYSGDIILNTRVTPTKKIKSYVKWITGFTPQDLRNKRRDIEIIKEVQDLVRGRILVGHDLTSDLEVLEINRKSLLGIRDLSTSIVLKEKMDCDNDRLKLDNVAEKLLGKTVLNAHGQHCGLRDVQAIREIYMMIETQWSDTIPIDDGDYDEYFI